MTPHNEAKRGDFAKTVLMPGDPLRAEYITKTFLENCRLVNNVRGIHGYTGFYKGEKVSVMASGMGMPSIGIYSYELFTEYNVENIIRVGSVGGYSENVKVRDVILAQGASYDTNFLSQYQLPGTFSATADFTLLETAVNALREKGEKFHVGNILSSDVFYNDNPLVVPTWQKMGILGVEMEAAALYATAARLNKRALAVLTVSDHLITKEETTALERQTTFNQMIEIALETAVRMAKI